MPWPSRVIATIGGLLASAAAFAAAPKAPPAPNLAPEDAPQYARFLRADEHRAFAVGPNGQFGWSSGRDDWFAAILGAVYSCNKAGQALCAAYAVDDAAVFGVYDANVAASNAALKSLRGVKLESTYAGEASDDSVAPTTTIHSLNASGATPVAVPGARLILTRYVVANLAGPDRPLLLDVANSWGGHETLPGAIWMRGAGDDAADKNDELTALFKTLLATVAPDRNTPIIVFCDSEVCWASYNAALRAVTFGYVNVYWYRGGVAAWRAAGLPTVTSVLLAQLW